MSKTEKKVIVMETGIMDVETLHQVYTDGAEYMAIEIDERGYDLVSELIRRITTGESGNYLPVGLQLLQVEAKFPGRLYAIEDDGSEAPDFEPLENFKVLSSVHPSGWLAIPSHGELGDEDLHLAVDVVNGGWQIAITMITENETPYAAIVTRDDWEKIGQALGWR